MDNRPPTYIKLNTYRAETLPADYRAAWEQIKGHLSLYSDFAGRNLTPVGWSVAAGVRLVTEYG